MTKSFATFLVTLSFGLSACSGGSNDNKAAAPSAKDGGVAGAVAANDGKAAPPAGAGAATIVLDPEGLRAVETVGGRTDPLAFGSPADRIVAELNGMFDSQPTDDGTNADCGAGPTRIVQWANGFSILAQDGKFAGWETEQAGQSFANGIRVGSTRAEVVRLFKPEVATGSLGTGFTTMSGETPFGGYLSGEGPEARVTSLFAGITCHFG